MSFARRHVTSAWAVVLAVLLLGPALAPGYVLTYDMVWVPQLALRPDALGLGSALPRAVPSDALVAVLDQLVPGMLLQKIVLLGSLATAGAGGAALVPRLSLPVRCLVVSLFVWNPFVVERLVLGQWPVLVGYAVLPWLLVVGRRHRLEGRLPAALPGLLVLGSLSASAGIASAFAVLAIGLSGRRRPDLTLLGVVLAANAPWVVAGLLHSSVATSDRAGAAAFALRAEGLLPAPLTALGLGGVWNSEVVPVTRDGPLAVVLLVVMLALTALGVRLWWAGTVRRDAVALALCWTAGWGLAVLSWAAPGVMAWLAGLPGGGVLRDGSRLLGLCVPLLAVLVGHGVQRLAALSHDRDLRRLVTGMLVLMPLAFMPDAAWGSFGRLRAVDYPASYDVAREAVGDGAGADVLLLPFTSYRAPDWNGERKVLNPLGRYLRPDYVASDELRVARVVIAGEDPAGDDVRAALLLDTPDARARALAGLGIGTVVVDASAGEAPTVTGEELVRAGDLTVLGLDRPRASDPPGSWSVAMGAAWAAWLGCLVLAAATALRRRARERSAGA
ncbi:MAG: hypothetical protein Q7J48_05390 [Nocardioides sp.]|nr:hypothetical protein [Nocardioides sp.]